MKRYQRLLFALFFILIPVIVSAQTKITFRIDMRPQMKESSFLPSAHTIELTGNQLPFSKTRTIKLKDRPRVDSIFVATLNFPSLTNGKVLEYNYIIKADTGNTTEQRPRLLRLNRQNRTLNVVLFNRFGH